ncbi:MAG: ATP-binding protein [Bacteroidota bacterium]|nr:ATP-binding protein [Bacteroidota bacterium]
MKIKIPSKVLKRDSYVSRIIPFMRKPIIKVLTGQRRVGKSYLLFQLIEQILKEEPQANVIYINKEDLEFDFIQDAKGLNDYVVSKFKSEGMNYIFIDEIQDITDFEKALRSLLLNERNDIYITGSNARMLSGELATSLTGRYIEFSIYSLSYPEFLRFHNLNDSDSSLSLFSRFGGFPYLINLPLEEEIVSEYLKNIYSTILFRDIVSRYNLRNTNILEKLVQFLADNTGSIFSAKSISDFLKSQNTNISSNQIQTYVGYLTNAFLIHKVERYDMVGKRIFTIGEKYYFENLGLRNIIVGYKPQDAGKILENLVYNHLLFIGFKIKIGALGANEIDFICEKRAEKIYIQVALQLTEETTIQREFGNLLKIPDNYPKMVITNDRFTGNSFEGIKHLYIGDFLLLEDF